MSVSLRIQRGHDDKTQTLGVLFVQKDGRAIAAFPCLELAWKGNQNRVSCIPPGRYRVVHRKSRKFGWHLHVQQTDGREVSGRKYILIHAGNRHDHILGCILPGMGFGDAGGDGRVDVVNSRTAMNQIRSLVPKGGCPLYVHMSPEHDAKGFDLRPESAKVNG
ncbi:MAG: DUF5675 family protein [Bacteroidota bacterium]